jgi:hypothetical protein
MNANQVVIVMDREELADVIVGYTKKDTVVQAKLRAALDRDPDELEARIAQAIADSMGGFAEQNARDFIPEARAVLDVLGQEEGPE